MTFRVQLCGGADLRSAAGALGLVLANDGKPDLALIDLRDDASLACAAELPPTLPRVAVVGEAQLRLARAIGVPGRAVSTSSEPAALGPLIAAAVPREARRSTRSVLITSPRGGVGRSLLVSNLARRLADTRSVFVLDLTGTGAVAWWLGAEGGSWAELELLAHELTGEHLAVVAVEAGPGIRIAGGAPRAATPRLAVAAARAALEVAEMVLLDAPTIADPAAVAVSEVVDRILLLTYDDPVSVATLAATTAPEGAWLIASQSRAASLAGRDAFRSLPSDEAAVAAAAGRRGPVGGALGRGYDELAELLRIDAS